MATLNEGTAGDRFHYADQLRFNESTWKTVRSPPASAHGFRVWTRTTQCMWKTVAAFTRSDLAPDRDLPPTPATVLVREFNQTLKELFEPSVEDLQHFARAHLGHGYFQTMLDTFTSPAPVVQFVGLFSYMWYVLLMDPALQAGIHDWQSTQPDADLRDYFTQLGVIAHVSLLGMWPAVNSVVESDLRHSTREVHPPSLDEPDDPQTTLASFFSKPHRYTLRRWLELMMLLIDEPEDTDWWPTQTDPILHRVLSQLHRPYSSPPSFMRTLCPHLLGPAQGVTEQGFHSLNDWKSKHPVAVYLAGRLEGGVHKNMHPLYALWTEALPWVEYLPQLDGWLGLHLHRSSLLDPSLFHALYGLRLSIYSPLHTNAAGYTPTSVGLAAFLWLPFLHENPTFYWKIIVPRSGWGGGVNSVPPCKNASLPPCEVLADIYGESLSTKASEIAVITGLIHRWETAVGSSTGALIRWIQYACTYGQVVRYCEYLPTSPSSPAPVFEYFRFVSLDQVVTYVAQQVMMGDPLLFETLIRVLPDATDINVPDTLRHLSPESLPVFIRQCVHM